MATVSGNTLTGSLSTETPITGNITVGTVNITAGADMSNYYDKEEVDGLLLGKADLEHSHDEYALQSDIPSIEGLATEEYVNEKFDSIDIPEVDLSGLATKEDLNGKADSEHVHEEYLTEHQDLSHLATKEELPSIDGLASTTYVDNAINTALNGIESQLDQIIGEEV